MVVDQPTVDSNHWMNFDSRFFCGSNASAFQTRILQEGYVSESSRATSPPFFKCMSSPLPLQWLSSSCPTLDPVVPVLNAFSLKNKL